MSDCYIISVKHTSREHAYITVWRPEDKGYAWPLSWAGKYSEADVLAGRDYYHRGDDTLAVHPARRAGSAADAGHRGQQRWAGRVEHMGELEVHPGICAARSAPPPETAMQRRTPP